jgi:hypothetical protein
MLASPVLEEQILESLAQCFYEAVPAEFQTFCALTALVTQLVLQRFGVASELLPCQLWYAGRDRNHVIGFVGHRAQAGKWDGHVVCTTSERIIDTAVHHLHRDLGLQVPRVIVVPRFNIPSQAIARFDVNATDRIWWHHAPSGADTTPPPQPAEMVEQLATRLEACIRQLPSARSSS